MNKLIAIKQMQMRQMCKQQKLSTIGSPRQACHESRRQALLHYLLFPAPRIQQTMLATFQMWCLHLNIDLWSLPVAKMLSDAISRHIDTIHHCRSRSALVRSEHAGFQKTAQSTTVAARNRSSAPQMWAWNACPMLLRRFVSLQGMSLKRAM